jgi:hypothetical protein
MKSMGNGSFPKRAAATFVLVTLFALLAPDSFAKKGKNKGKESGPTARVVAHLPLEGAVARQMFLQSQGGRQYLYIDQGAKQGYAVVDVTKPSQPSVVKHVDAGKLRVVGSGIAITETPEGDTSKTVARSHPPTESVKILDTSDPANPRTVQTFNGVTSILQDGGRNLIYLTNDEGLWILTNPPERLQPERKKKPCDSESAIAAMPPDCE